MTEISDRYERCARGFAAKVAGVPDDRWASPTPCQDWTALELVQHVVDNHGLFVGFIDRELPSAPPVEDEPEQAFDVAHRTVLRLLEDPATATQTYEGHLGVRTFEWAVDTFLTFDLVVHGWDLARATGQDERIDPAELARVAADARSWGEMARAPGVFGPELEAPPDADEQARFLAFIGRQP